MSSGSELNGRGARWLVMAAACALACAATAAVPGSGTLLSDLPSGERERLGPPETLPEDPRALLEHVLALDAAYRFDVGLIVADTDRRWYRTVSSDEPESPLLELRRWPGDTVLALYALKGGFESSGAAAPPVPGGRFEEPTDEPGRRWTGTLDTDSGERSVVWQELEVDGVDARLGALMLPGDAGLGAGAHENLLIEIEAVLDRVELRPAAWVAFAPVITDTVVVPGLGMPPGQADEREDPWQIAVGADFTLGLPPGIRSRQVGPGLRGPLELDGGKLWLRGRFLNAEGEPVVIGDAAHAGYVVQVDAPDAAWRSGKTAPRGAPAASRIAGAPFDMAVERTRATAARAERWEDPGFPGEWLLFRLELPERAVEIGLPILEGRKTESLFRIPLTWRGPGEAPAPPPVDPAQRFGIRFERLRSSDRKRNPWIEGYLHVPGLRLELPRGWSPVARLRSEDGYPVALVDPSSTHVARLIRLEPGDDALAESLHAGWAVVERPKRFHAESAWDRPDGARVYLAREGHAYVVEPISDVPPPGEDWARLLDSAYLLRSEP